MNSDHDRGWRKFRGMLHTQWMIAVTAVLFAWRGWPETLYESSVWGICLTFVGFAVPNVAEKLIDRWPTRSKPQPEEKK